MSSYIEKLQNENRLYHEFFLSYKELSVAEHKLENTAYKGDAQKAATKAHAKIDNLEKIIDAYMADKNKNKEVVNA